MSAPQPPSMTTAASGSHGAPKRRRCQEAPSTEAAGGDMFDVSSDAAAALNSARSASRAIGLMNEGLRKVVGIAAKAGCGEEWDDADGYYKAEIGESLGDGYLVVQNSCGRGLFSSIVKARTISQSRDDDRQIVAIKVIRAGELMSSSAEKEVEILRRLQETAGEGKRYVVQLLSTFCFRGHMCLVFESLWDDMREALRKCTNGRGMTLVVVRGYVQQLLLGLRHIHKSKVIHGDIKPDNILLSDCQKIVKLCDLGTAVKFEDACVAPYLMSLYYRAPEIILGCKCTAAVDVFALACTIYELFTGKVLLAGRGAADQLKRSTLLLGDIPEQVIKQGTLRKKYFGDSLILEIDPIGRKVLKDLILERVGPARCQATDQTYVLGALQLASLLEEMLSLDPGRRKATRDALRHPFILDRIPTSQVTVLS